MDSAVPQTRRLEVDHRTHAIGDNIRGIQCKADAGLFRVILVVMSVSSPN